jgi:imidazolonepropionase-like amidohydrolase
MLGKRVSIVVSLLLTLGMPAICQMPVAITGARILTVSDGVVENGTVLIENGKIAAVGTSVKIPAGTEIIDGRKKVVMPGMIDSGDQLGLVEIPFLHVTDDSNESTDPIHPELRVADALNGQSENIRVARPGGVTNSIVTPGGGNVISGQSAVIQLDGDSTAQFVVKAPAALHVNLGEESKETYGNKDRAPKTRMGTMAMVRQAFLKAQSYQAKKSSTPDDKTRDLKMEALVAALNREIPVVVHANRVSDIESAIRLGDEFQLRIIIAEGTGAWRLADELAKRNIPVIVGPIFQAPGRIEAIDSRLDNAALLNNAGVKISLQTGSVNGVRDLWLAVSYALANGLPQEAALATVTINPAEMFGVRARLGSVEVGKDANLLILDGAPFLVRTHVLTVLIDGKKVDLSNHQTELYELYKKKYEIQ